MSRETWMLMVQVARQKLEQAPKRRKQRKTLEQRCIREDHFALLLAAGY